jgi:hypothetical protein
VLCHCVLPTLSLPSITYAHVTCHAGGLYALVLTAQAGREPCVRAAVGAALGRTATRATGAVPAAWTRAVEAAPPHAEVGQAAPTSAGAVQVVGHGRPRPTVCPRRRAGHVPTPAASGGWREGAGKRGGGRGGGERRTVGERRRPAGSREGDGFLR